MRCNAGRKPSAAIIWNIVLLAWLAAAHCVRVVKKIIHERDRTIRSSLYRTRSK